MWEVNILKVDYSKKYINPYNFVQLEDNCTRSDATKYDGNLTGYINCTLTTKTPLIIPDTEEKNVEKEKLVKDGKNMGEHVHYKFYSYGDNNPIIPGSELRGMLRNDFELFTNSCMSSIDADKTFISRTKEVKKPGILKKDEDGVWRLYEAERYAICTYSNSKEKGKLDNKYRYLEKYKVNRHDNTLNFKNQIINTGEQVSFVPVSRGTLVQKVTDSKENNVKTGILFIGEAGMRKNKDSIFVMKNSKVKYNDDKNEKGQIKEIQRIMESLKNIYDLYKDQGMNKNISENKPKWYGGYNIKEMMKNGVMPVWYEVLNKRLYVSVACIGKEEYLRTLKELSGTYTPCIEKRNLCDACNLFGFVSDDDATGSRIRVSDAIFVEQPGKEKYMKEIILQELASPRSSNPIFYSLFKTNADLISGRDSNFEWNYDFVSRSENRKIVKKIINDGDIKIRGRKLYWHHQPNMNERIEKTKRNSSVIPVNSGNIFKFKVYFENITEKDLRKLVAVINLKYNKDDYHDLCHKIGKGKPLGYGSVKIVADNVKVRKLKIDSNKIVSYSMEDSSAKDESLDNAFVNQLETTSFKEALRIYDFNYINRNYSESLINYPQGVSKKGQQASLFWFTQNRSTKLGANTYVNMVLPTISEGKEIKENDTGLKGSILRNGREIVKIDGLNMPIFVEEDTNNNRNKNRNNNNYGGYNRNNFRRK